MLVDTPSPTAFTPPLLVLYEPAGGRGVGSPLAVRPRGLPRPKPNVSASTAKIEELSIEYAGERTALALERARMVIELTKRLQFLRVEAEVDQITFSESSLTDFNAFMLELGPRFRPSLFLNDNGNLRALWKNDDGEQVGLQFVGDGMIQFVIFRQRKGSAMMTRVAGVDMQEKILGHIRASGAEGLLFA